MDLFVLVQKLDAHGTHLQEFTIPNQSAMVQDLTEQGGVLYHAIAQNQQTAQTIQSQSAQTTAVAAGSQARVVATSAAAAESKSAAAAVNEETPGMIS